MTAGSPGGRQRATNGVAMRRRCAGILVAVSVVASLAVGASTTAAAAATTTTTTTSARPATSTTTTTPGTTTTPATSNASSGTLADAKKLLVLIPAATRDGCFRQRCEQAHTRICRRDLHGAVHRSRRWRRQRAVRPVRQRRHARHRVHVQCSCGAAGLARWEHWLWRIRDWFFGTTLAGTYTCFTSGSTPTVVWNAPASGVLGIATGPDATKLMTWWRQSAGPTNTADTVTHFLSGSAAAHKAAAKELLSNRGSKLTNCKSKLGAAAPRQRRSGLSLPGSRRHRRAPDPSTGPCTSRNLPRPRQRPTRSTT